MRVLVVSTRPGPAADRLAAMAEALAAREHTVRWGGPGSSAGAPEPAARAVLSTIARVARELPRFRPAVALLRASPGMAAIAALLRAARVPYVVDVDDRPRPADGLPEQGEAAALTVLLSGAARVLASSAAAAARARRCGARAVEVIATLEPLPDPLPGARADARRALDLPLDHAILAHTGPLDGDARLELLAEAHRHAAGVGLLVCEHGPRGAFAHAMTLSTRPSSPVLVLEGQAAPAALWAADALVWLGSAHARAATDPLALGRRIALVGPALEATYPAALEAVHVAEGPTPRAVLAAMLAAVEAERRHGPLPAAAVRAARAALDGRGRAADAIEAARLRR